MKKHQTQIALAAGLWILVVSIGFAKLNIFVGTPGAPGQAGSRWPEGTTLELAHDELTLVMLLHPKCSCSLASLHELEHVMVRTAAPLRPILLFTVPEGSDESWRNGPAFRAASNIEGARIIFDINGVQTKHFGAFTSGQTLLYRPDGTLSFQGGITMARGHEGDNAGADALVAAISTHASTPATDSRAVFGCDLVEPKKVES